MAKKKKVANILKLQIPAGAANPSPPVGPALGQAGLNIMDFCNAFNDFNGVVEEVDYERNSVKVSVQILGRSTSVQLNFMQIEKT